MKREIPEEFLQHLKRRHQVELAGSGVSVRAVLIGLGLVLAVSLGAPYSIWIVGSSEITWSYFPVGVGVPFILLIFANALLKRLRRTWSLKPAELITIVVMGLVASGMPIFIVGYIVGIISKPYYGALPQNKWEIYIQPYLPDWLIPGPEDHVMRYFYEGLPLGEERIPFAAWLTPLAWWLSLIVALYFVCFCMVVLLRKPWVEQERLAFPLIEVPLLLTQESPDSTLPPVLRCRSFWIGCAIPLGIILFNIIGYFQPGSPQIPIHQGNLLLLMAGAPPINLMIYFPVVGFTYLVPTSISFSIWFFYLFNMVETNMINWTGVSTMRPDAFVWDWKILSWQSYGAFTGMVLWSLWIGRHHLRAVVNTVFRSSAEIDDAGEMISYRLAVYGGLAGVCYILAWLCRAGMDLHVAALFLFAALIIFLGITRLVIQSGIHYFTTPMTAQGLTLAITGTGVGPHNLIALALCYAWCGDVQSTFMPSAAHAAKLHGLYQQRRSLGLTLSLGLAVVVSFVATSALILYLCYDYGAGNLRSWFFNTAGGAGGMAFDAAVRQLRDPWPTDWTKLSYFGAGALLYSLLSFFHYRFFWWPLHPMGLAISSIWMLKRIVLSIFIAWAAKRLVLRFGGAALYRRLRPFFIGLVIGFYLGVGISYGVDVIWFFGKGHPILHG